MPMSMTSHIHLIVTAFEGELQNVIRDFKSIPQKINRSNTRTSSMKRIGYKKFSFEAQNQKSNKL
jgi:predicted amidohydrolase YtcJ